MTYGMGGDNWSHIQTKHQTNMSFLTESTKHHNVKEFKKTFSGLLKGFCQSEL